MAKRTTTQIPMPTGGGPLRKIVGVAVVIALLVIVVKYPADAADAATSVGRFAGELIDGLWNFFRQLG